MEILLLTLLGGLTVGIGLWAALGDSKKPDSSMQPGTGPVSSPQLPEAGLSDPADKGEIGQPIVIGDSQKASQEALQDFLEKAPQSVSGNVVKPPYDPKKRKKGTSNQPLKVTYSTDEIISRSSRFSHHRRSLSTAESLVEHQKAEEAIHIYERTKNRLTDKEAKEKIDINIDDINKWLSRVDVEDDGLHFPEIIIPLTTHAIALENLNEGLKAISGNLLDRINEVLTRIQDPGTASSSPVDHTPLPSGDFPAQAPMLPPQPQAKTGDVVPPPNSPAEPSGQPVYPPQVYIAPGIPAHPTALPDITEAMALGLEKQTGTQSQTDDLPPGFELDDKGDLLTDGWADEDFDKEWDKYKDLPLKDRRSGKDRRLSIDRRRSNDPSRRDRRSGIERRKNDLFAEREEFLKKLEEHKKRKKELEDKKIAPPQPKKPEVEEPIAAPLAKEAEPEKKPEPEPEEEKKPEPEPEIEEEKEPVESLTQIVAPELDPVGMPSATEPYIEPPITASAGSDSDEAEDSSDEGMPSTPALSDGVEEVGDIPSLGFDEPEGEEGEGELDQDKPAPQEIHGVLELKPPEEDDAPFLTLTYDFAKIPDSFKLSADYHTMEFAYYKYKPMLVKAQEFTRRKMLKNALNYYRVIKSQNIPSEFKRMVNRNIKDITEYLEKFLMSRG